MIKDAQLDLALASLPSYEIASYDGRNGRYRMMGKSDELIVLRHDKASDMLRLDALMHFDAEYLNLYSYSKLAEICHKYDCSITAPMPYVKEPGHTQVQISSSFIYSTEPTELEVELLRFSSAIGSMKKYFLGFLQACQLDNVDISMFIGIDLQPARLLYMAEQKEIQYGTWDMFIDSVFEADTPDSVKEIVLPYLDACKRFEEANPSLRVAEVAQYLTDLVEHHSQSKPEKLDIN